MRLLCKWGEPNARDLYGVAPLHKAVAFGQVRRSVQLLHNDTTTQRHNDTTTQRHNDTTTPAMALLTMALLTMALLTMALLTMALLTMALLTMALLTMATLAMAGEQRAGAAGAPAQPPAARQPGRGRRPARRGGYGAGRARGALWRRDASHPCRVAHLLVQPHEAHPDPDHRPLTPHPTLTPNPNPDRNAKLQNLTLTLPPP